MTDAWPLSILSPRSISRRIVARTLRGTVSISGFTQRVSPPAHAWLISYDTIPVHTAEQIRTWDALEAKLDGGANAILVPIIEGDRPPPSAAFTDGTIFTDGTSFTDMSPAVGTVIGAASAGATEITIELAEIGGEVLAGHHFSIGERLYRIAEVQSMSGDQYTVSIRPPLRDDVADQAPADFGTLRCKCRLASDDEMQLTLTAPGIGFPSMSFVEDPN